MRNITLLLTVLLGLTLALSGCPTTAPDDDDDNDDSSAEDDDDVVDDDDSGPDDDDVVDDDDSVADDDDVVDDDDSGDDDDDVVDDDDSGDDDDAVPEWSIEDVQGGVVTPGQLIELAEVVVTGVDIAGSGDGIGMFVSESTGGMYSGLWVYTAVGAEAFSVGQTVDVVGWYEEYDNGGAWPATLTEIDIAAHPLDSGITVSSNPAPQPNPTVVPVADLLAEVTAEPWEGALITIENLTVVDADLGYGEWSVDGGARVDDKLYAFGVLSPGDTFTSITGVLDYSYGDYKLEPRDAADFVGHVPAAMFADDIPDGALVITEIMADPGGNCSGTDDEYFELYNAGTETFNLQGLELAFAASNNSIDDPVLLAPGEYLLSVRESPSPCYGHAGDVEVNMPLSNSGGMMQLIRPGDLSVIDEVDFSAITIPDGASLQLTAGVLTAAGNDAPTNWCPSTTAIASSGDFGTPDLANDVTCP